MPAQRGGSRAPGPFPPSALPPVADVGWTQLDLDEFRRQQEFDLWCECVDAALAPLRARLDAAYAVAYGEYDRRLRELREDRSGG